MKDEYKNLYQLHFQKIKHPYDVVEFVAQKRIKTNSEMQDWMKAVAQEHPLPDGLCWSIHNWDSPSFVKALKEIKK